MPRIEDLLDRLQGATVFSKIDMASGYHQVAIEEEDKHKTAFVTKFGAFEWNVLPFGLCNGPGMFMRMMNRILPHTMRKYVVVNLDDILIFSKSKDEHEEHLQQVLQLLDKEKLKLKASKCSFFQKGVDFVGFWVDHEGVHTEANKVQAVKDWPQPTTVKDIKGFLGLTGFYRKFIEKYAHIAVPLYNLSTLPKKTMIRWDTTCQHAFDELKRKITSAPVLGVPTKDGVFTLRTDASKFAMGAVLTQEQQQLVEADGVKQQLTVDRVIGYFSRKMRPVEGRYPTYNRELLALKEGILHFQYYLYGNHFTAFTDHASLQHILRQRRLTSRQMSLLDTIQHFDYDIRYWPGARNQVADALSRRSNHEENLDTAKEEALAAELGKICVTEMVGLAGNEWVKSVVQNYKEDPYFRPVWKIIREGEKGVEDKELEKKYGRTNVVRRKRFWKNEETGLLMTKRRTDNNSEEEEEGGVVCIPRGGGLRHTLFHETHDTEAGGHFGGDRTFALLHTRFFWPQC